MTVGVASIGSRADTNSRSVYTCEVAAVPSADSLILVGVLMNDAAGTVIEPSSVSGLGMVFSLVTSSVTFNPSTNGLHNLSLWRAADSFPGGSIVSVAFPAAPNGCSILIHQCSGLTPAGSSGANAVGKSLTSLNDTVNNSTITATAPSAASTANGWFSIGAVPDSTAPDRPGQNWTFLQAAGFTGNATGLSSGFTTLSTGTSAVWSSVVTARRAAIIMELVADNPIVAASVVTVTYQRQDRSPDRLPPVPSSATGPLAEYLRACIRILNAEAYISKFSAANPNTSGVTGIPGNLAVNVGSASTWTRLWILGGSTASVDTNGWQMVRMA
jgi:hypothetical protein